MAQLFGAAKIVGSDLKASKNPKARDKLSGKPQLNKSRTTIEDRAQKKQVTRAIHTWTRRERNQQRDQTAKNLKLHGKKREADSEVDDFGLLAKRVQMDCSEDNTPYTVAGAEGQPRQKQ